MFVGGSLLFKESSDSMTHISCEFREGSSFLISRAKVCAFRFSTLVEYLNRKYCYRKMEIGSISRFSVFHLANIQIDSFI